jgi:putative two-component system response regulator
MARRISLTHHEKWDGSGYPAGLHGDEIPLEGRIAAICDVYDALVSTRPYKSAWTPEQAVNYVRENRGTHFEPVLVDAFLRILPAIDAIQLEFAEG